MTLVAVEAKGAGRDSCLCSFHFVSIICFTFTMFQHAPNSFGSSLTCLQEADASEP